MKSSNSLEKIAPAILRAQCKIRGVVPNQKNPFFKSEYADLGACWDAVKDALHDEQIALIQTMGFITGAGPTLVTTLLHSSGEFISGEQPICAKADDPQAAGSAISYARRYGLSAMLSLVERDDDGEKAMQRPGQCIVDSPAPAVTAARPANVHTLAPKGEYQIPFGKFQGKTLAMVGKAELVSYAAYMRQQAQAKNQPIEGPAADLLARIEVFAKG